MDTDSDTKDATRNSGGVDPLAICTLPAGGQGDRLAWIRDEILPHAVASERIENGIAWEFDDAPDLASKLDKFVALERDCCSSIEFDLTPSEATGRLRLEVRGVDPRAAVFSNLALPSGSRRRSAAGGDA